MQEAAAFEIKLSNYNLTLEKRGTAGSVLHPVGENKRKRSFHYVRHLSSLAKYKKTVFIFSVPLERKA